MKKILAIITVLSLIFALSACNVKDVTKMATVGDEAAGKGVFNFYLYQGMNAAMSAAQSSGATLTAESGEEAWNTVKIGEVSAAQYAIEEAKNAIKTAYVLKAVAVKEGMTLTDEEKASLTTQRNDIIEQFGGRYNYEQYFTAGGFTLEDVDEIIETETYAQKVISKYFGDGVTDGEVTVSDDEVKKVLQDEYVMAKHILISNAAPAAEEGEEETSAEEADAAAKAKAEELIKALDGGANFDTLMKENTADVNSETGEINGEDGYFFTKGQMVAEFETEAFALEVGAYSKEPVGTTYGYHILKKLANPTEGEEYDTAFETVKAQLLSDKLDTMVDQWAEELGFKFNDKAISNVEIIK